VPGPKAGGAAMDRPPLDRIAMPRFDWEQARRTVCSIVVHHIFVSTVLLPPINSIDWAFKLTIGRTCPSGYVTHLIELGKKHQQK
jgi:hypothetical protein